jgi:hypothetical protein
MQLVGANTVARVSGFDELPGKANYFVSRDPTRWRTNVPTYAKVKYEQVYPGIDLVYYGNQQQLEYDFIVVPGADPQAIRLAFVGAHGCAPLRINENGDLIIGVNEKEVRFHRPYIYQEINGVKQPVEGRYVLVAREGEETNSQPLTSNPQVSFAIAAYDTTKPLIIDPVLSYATYLGDTFITDLAVDAAGNVYAVGSTREIFSPAPGACSENETDFCSPVLILKLDQTGSTVLYATYLGDALSSALGITIDAGGNAYITGTTNSVNFPTTPGAYQRQSMIPETCQPGFCERGFVTKLDPTGSTLLYSTYLGKEGRMGAQKIAIDPAGKCLCDGT